MTLSMKKFAIFSSAFFAPFVFCLLIAILNGGETSEFMVGILDLIHEIYILLGAPASLLVTLLFSTHDISRWISASKFADVYLVGSMAVLGYLQWTLILALVALFTARRRRHV